MKSLIPPKLQIIKTKHNYGLNISSFPIGIQGVIAGISPLELKLTFGVG